MKNCNRVSRRSFVHDQLATVFSLLAGAGTAVQLPGADVVEVLEGVCQQVGFPATIQVDLRPLSPPV
jgi:hypothetical protein